MATRACNCLSSSEVGIPNVPAQLPGGVDRKVAELKEVRHSGDLQEASGVSVPRARRDTKLQPKPRSEWFVARSLPSATVTSSVVFFPQATHPPTAVSLLAASRL
jgi:hypothetical protein